MALPPTTTTTTTRSAGRQGEAEGPLVWVDLEMSGLDAEGGDVILELACIITQGTGGRALGEAGMGQGQLPPLLDLPTFHRVVHQPESVLQGMNAWCTEHHGKSGLTQKVRDSPYTLEAVTADFLAFLRTHVPAPRHGVLAGNSVHADRVFLSKYMPVVVEHLHYRIVDVSTVKELCRRWYPEVLAQAPKKAMGHRALDDIVESIRELAYYQRTIFRPPPNDAGP